MQKCCKSKKKQGHTARGGKYVANRVSNRVGVPKIQFIIDSGASCNIIDRQLWEELKKNKVKYISRKYKKKLFAYGSTEPLDVAGCFSATIELNERIIQSLFLSKEKTRPH